MNLNLQLQSHQMNSSQVWFYMKPTLLGSEKIGPLVTTSQASRLRIATSATAGCLVTETFGVHVWCGTNVDVVLIAEAPIG